MIGKFTYKHVELNGQEIIDLNEQIADFRLDEYNISINYYRKDQIEYDNKLYHDVRNMWNGIVGFKNLLEAGIDIDRKLGASSPKDSFFEKIDQIEPYLNFLLEVVRTENHVLKQQKDKNY